MGRKTPLMQRFWTKVQIPATPDSCWLWMASVNTSGYGQIGDGKGKLILASHVAYRVYNGEIPEGKQVLHTCDNPLCVNPNHLWLGTHSDNMHDREEKGRGTMHKGHPRHPRRRINQEMRDKVHELRKQGLLQREIGEILGIPQTAVSYILRGLHGISN